MNKISKIVISVIIGIVTMFGIQSVSNAYSVGQEITVTYNQYISSNNIFCMEHGQKLTTDNNYIIQSNIKIEGIKSTDHTGKSIEDKRNAKFAYILSGDNGNDHDNGPVQNGVWNYGYTWVKNIGQYHKGLGPNFANSVKGENNEETVDLNIEATEYANNIKNATKVTDNTNKDKIKVKATNKDGKQYIRIGPFNWTFGGKLSKISIYDQNGELIKGKLYSTFKSNEEKWIDIGDVKSGADFYISMPADSGVSEITKIEGKMKVDLKAVDIWFLKSKIGDKQNLIITKPYETTETVDLSFNYNISILGNLKVIKVDEDNTQIKLSGVGFYIQNKETGEYVKKVSDGTITYVKNRNKATEFVTNKNGRILINNLIVGTYVAYETKNPNYGYEIISEGKEKEVVVNKTAELEITNKQKYIKLSGYVWVDKQSSKNSYRNDLYKTDEHPEINEYKDDQDILLDGITVRLIDKTTGKQVKETTTANGGKYQFTDVLKDDLDKYYVEFEYDGLTYTNVASNIDKDTGSKAQENAKVRDDFNKDFSVVEGKTENTSITRNSAGNEKHTITYNIDQANHTATLNNTGLYTITANTSEAKCNIKDYYETYYAGEEEIENINLGLYEREQPDIALLKDLENVKVAVNGYNHVYEYAQRINNAGIYEQGFNVGVKFGTGKEDEYGNMSYSRAVYTADYEYTTSNGTNELEVYVTYRIRMKNESSNLKVKVNSIVDYFDSKYEITAVGTELNNSNDPNGNISYSEATKYDDNYSKTIINTNMEIEKQSHKDIYVQFKLNRDAVINILNDKENLQNVAEINSYSVFNGNSVYAGIDKDSNPGNVVPGNIATYQDDTDSAPGLKLEVAEARELTGKVFLDDTSNELMTGKVRQGSGAYEEGEKGISGVEVTLTETTGTGKVYTATTNETGDFTISGFIPGDYTLTYKWGDGTYTVQNYKGTIYDSTRNQDKNWYKDNVDTRLTDAIDDYGLREQIDYETKDVNGTTTTTINKMNSTTPTMGIGVEYETTYTASKGDKYIYQIKNVDFGIVERARQDIALEKRVTTFKITLANGQVIADVTIDENGKMTGQTNHVTYMGPSATTMPNNGYVKLELDSELIQGATVEVGYEIKATNNSELDYLSEEFYKYGEIKGNLVTITPSAIVDYLDKDWAFDADKNKEWTVKNIEDIKNIVSSEVYGDNSEISDKTILYTESLKQELEPTKSASVMLNVSKVLANSDEISLDNEAEVVKVEKTGGTKIQSTPGNYIPGTGHTESDDTIAETVIVTPNTGDNLNFIVPAIVGVIALTILAGGITIIKKKTL